MLEDFKFLWAQPLLSLKGLSCSPCFAPYVFSQPHNLSLTNPSCYSQSVSFLPWSSTLTNLHVISTGFSWSSFSFFQHLCRVGWHLSLIWLQFQHQFLSLLLPSTKCSEILLCVLYSSQRSSLGESSQPGLWSLCRTPCKSIKTEQPAAQMNTPMYKK